MDWKGKINFETRPQVTGDNVILTTKTGEINAVASKATPASADVLLIEDSAASYAKKKITINSIKGLPTFQFYADQFMAPWNANWAVNNLAPAALDTVNAALIVRRFDDSIVEGVGFMVRVPSNATSINFVIQGRAQTAPGGSQGVVAGLYRRLIPNNSAVGAWSAIYNFTTLTIPTNTNFQTSSQNVTLATLGLTAGETYQFEFVRNATSGSDTLSGDWNLLLLGLEFV